jgi:hypothetical protein
MAKQKSASYLSPRKLLSKVEYAKYKAQQQEPRRAELLQKVSQGEKNLARFQSQQRYAKTKSGRFSSFLSRGIQKAQRPNPVASYLYESQMPITSQNVQQQYPSMPRTLKGSSGGRVGRPRGTYDMRYASVGGVYGYRRILAQQLRERRMQLQRQNTISPQQQMIINQVQSQERYNNQNVENRIIPDTYGQVDMNQIWRDIDSASRAVN